MSKRPDAVPTIVLPPICLRCHGAGWVSYGTNISPDSTWGAKCPRCHGTGRVPAVDALRGDG